MFITWGQGGVNFEPKKGGVRTAIEVCPVRVWVKRGAERGQTRLRGWGGGGAKNVRPEGVFGRTGGSLERSVSEEKRLLGDFELDEAGLGGVVELHGVAHGG